MGEIHIEFGKDQEIELDEIDIGVADGVIAFDVTGRITGLDESTVSQVAGKRLVPTDLYLEPQDLTENK